MNPTDKICLGIIVLVALTGFFFSSDFGIGTLNQYIPGFGDGFILYTDVNEPFLPGIPQEIQIDTSMKYSYSEQIGWYLPAFTATNWAQDVFPFSTKSTWVNCGSCEASKRYYRVECYVDFSVPANYLGRHKLTCDGGGGHVGTYLRPTGDLYIDQRCERIGDHTVWVNVWVEGQMECLVATGEGWLTNEDDVYVRKEFDIPEPTEGYYTAWLTFSSAEERECYINGEQINFTQGKNDISEYTKIGNNVVACHIKDTRGGKSVNIDVKVYEAYCQGIHKNDCSDWISIFDPLPNQWWCKSLRVIKSCEYDKWHSRIELVQGSKPPYDICMGQASFGGKELDIILSTSGESVCSATMSVTANTVKSFKNSYFRTEVEGIGNIYLGDKFLFSVPLGQKGLFEIVPSYLEPEMVDILFQGLSESRVNISGVSDGRISFKLSTSRSSGSLNLKNTRFLPIISCQKLPNEILGIETFTGGRTLSYFDMRNSPARYCLAHPIVITSEEGSLATAEPYMKLVRGEILHIPSDETWTLFYYFNVKEAGLTIDMCPAGETWDINIEECKDISGVSYLCSEGIWDSSIHACIVIPSIEHICEYGVYDKDVGKCIFHPPQAIICPINFDYDPITEKCIWEPEDKIICPGDSVYSPISKKCEIFPIQVICPPFSSFDSKKGKCVTVEGLEYSPLKSRQEACEISGGTWKISVCEFIPKIDYICKKGFILEDVEGRKVCIPEVESKYPTAVRFINWLIKNQTFIFFITIVLITFLLVGWYLMREE